MLHCYNVEALSLAEFSYVVYERANGDKEFEIIKDRGRDFPRSILCERDFQLYTRERFFKERNHVKDRD